MYKPVLVFILKNSLWKYIPMAVFFLI